MCITGPAPQNVDEIVFEVDTYAMQEVDSGMQSSLNYACVCVSIVHCTIDSIQRLIYIYMLFYTLQFELSWSHKNDII